VKTGCILAIVVGGVLAALTTVDARQEERGLRILNTSCRSCHGVRRVQIQAMDAAGWTNTVRAMVDEQGATVPEADVPVLIDYLARTYPPMPEGTGKEIVLNRCTVCHDLGVIRDARKSRADWEATLTAMRTQGAALNDEEFPVALNYLTANFAAR